MSGPCRSRLFFALWPPAATRLALASLAATHAPARARRTHPDDLHLTLVFVGEVEPRLADACAEVAAGVAGDAFELAIDTFGCFRRARIAWLGPRATPLALGALVDTLRAGLAAAAVPFDARPFRPHVTIAREARPTGADAAVPTVAWPVTDFSLVESVAGARAARYEVRASWPLRPAARCETARPPVR